MPTKALILLLLSISLTVSHTAPALADSTLEFGTITASTTATNSKVQLTCNITPSTRTSHYIFSWNNTGQWTNTTATAWTGNPTTLNGTWNSTETTVSVIVYANDTEGNWDASAQYNFPLTPKESGYKVTITPSPSSPKQGETVTFTLSVTKNGAPLTDYILNITRDNMPFKQVTSSSFVDRSTEVVSRTYSASALYDSELEANVDYSTSLVTVSWSASASNQTETETTAPTSDNNENDNGNTAPDSESTTQNLTLALIIIAVALILFFVYTSTGTKKP
jgi:hypothetical protein